MEFEVKSRVMNIGNRKGQTVYYAVPKTQDKMTTDMLVERIVRETSLSAGDVRNALISLSNIVNDALRMGMSVDLAELGNLRAVVTSKMMDTPEEVTVANALKDPKIVFTPKQNMRAAVKAMTRSIDRPATKGGTTEPEPGGDGGEEEGGSPL